MKTTIDRFGRMVIPKKVRDSLGLVPGAELQVEAKDGKIVAQSVKQEDLLVKKGGVWMFTGRLPKGLDTSEFIQAEREKQLRKFWPKKNP